MKLDKNGYELVTYRRVFYVETGWCDGGGIGYWNGTAESVRVESKAKAEKVKDSWIKSGKLKETPWGELRPNFEYGIFRIRVAEELVENPDD